MNRQDKALIFHLKEIETLKLALDKKNKELKELQKHLEKEKNENSKKIEEVKEYYENIIALMPGHVYWQDRNNVFLGCNDLQAKHAGLNSRKEIIGKTNYDMIWREQADDLNKLNWKVMETGKAHTAEEYAVMLNGPGFYLSQKVPLRNKKNEIIGILGISLNITDRKRAEANEKLALVQAAEAKTKAKAEAELRQAVSVLAGSIAHDLRTPLVITQMSGNFIKKTLPALQDAYYKAMDAKLAIEPLSSLTLKSLEKAGDSIIKSTQEMQEFINITLKTLSRALRGDLIEQDLVMCSMWHCLHNTLSDYPFSGRERELVHWDQKDFKFMGNELLFIRVISNLLKNSLEQIKKNQGGEVFITTEESNAANILRFKDTAGGIPSEVVPQLFKAYHTTKEEGTGVGLAFCKLTMESFGGNITCRSSYGEYIEFTLTFPKLLKASSP